MNLWILLGVISILPRMSADPGADCRPAQNVPVISCAIKSSDGRSDCSDPISIRCEIYGERVHEKAFCAVVDTVRDYIQKSGQVSFVVHPGKKPVSEHDIMARSAEGFLYVLFLEAADSGEIVGHVYDAERAALVLARRWRARADLHEYAAIISQDIWRALMGDEGSFTSSIAFVRRSKNGALMRYELCTTKWDGTDLQVLLARNMPIVAPVFYRGVKSGRGRWLFFSECTPVNVRLSVIREGSSGSNVVIDRPGTTVGVYASAEGEVALYCHSGSIWEYVYNESEGVGQHVCLIDGARTDPCSHPYRCRNGDVIYGQGGSIMRWSRTNKVVTPLVSEGYSVAPCVDELHGMLLFSQRVKGEMKIVAYTMATGEYRYITGDSGNHCDPVLSPCGRFVAYTRELGNMSEIWVASVISRRSWRVSPQGEYCAHVAWSSASKT